MLKPKISLLDVVIVVAILTILAVGVKAALVKATSPAPATPSLLVGGVKVTEQCRGGVKYLISSNAMTVMLDRQGLPYPC